MKEYSSAQTQLSPEIAVAKKHSFSYVFYVILFLFVALPFLFSKYSWIGILFTGFILMRVLALIKTQWTLTEDYLLIQGGVLPWKKIHFEIPLHDIYESFYTQGLLGKLFGFATITIRRTDGISTVFYDTKFTNYQVLVQELNQRIREIKSSNLAKTQNTQINIKGNLDLIKLAELYEKELITKEEFIEFKQKLIK